MKSSLFSFLFPALISCFVLAGCSRSDDEEINKGPAPVIEFKSISPSTVKQYRDSVVIRIGYSDADGDLGQNNADVDNAFVTDSRNHLTYNFRIRQLAPDNSTLYIKGTLEIVVPATALTGSGGSETLIYSVYVQDRAGNRSNTVTTSAITVIQ